MAVIKNIKMNEVEDSLKEIIGLSFQMKLFQEEYEDVMNQAKATKSSFSSGSISKDVYSKNKIVLEDERKRLLVKINETVENIKKATERIKKVIEENKI